MKKPKPVNIGEESLAVQLTAEGIEYTRQFKYAKGRNFQADFMLTDTNILVEINGGVWRRADGTAGAHGSISGILKDNERLNAATVNGWRVLRFTPQQVLDGYARAFIVDMAKEWV